MEYPLFDVFISYAHEDMEWAKWLHDGFSSRGLNVFWDEAVLRLGDNLAARVEQSLEHSIAVLLLLSRKSLDSAWVKFESSFNWTSTFIEGNRRLIPIIIEKGCEVPTRLRNLRSCEFTQKDDTKLQHLVDDLLSRKKLDIGPYYLDRARHLPEDLVKNIIQCIGRYMQPTARQLLLIESAITELVDNAFRHTNAERVSLEVHTTSSLVEVSVEDAGDGFDLRDTLIRSRQLLNDEPTVVGRRGLTLLEAQGVRLVNVVGGDRKQHCMKATMWWNFRVG